MPQAYLGAGTGDPTRFLLVPAGMTLARQELGKIGEDLAVRELERRGYAITARRYRTRCGEIDIVAERDGVLVFVEVKARGDAEFGTAAEAVTPWKQRRLTRMARDYLTREHIADRPCRFDVVTVMFDSVERGGVVLVPCPNNRTDPVIEVYVNAFDAC
jgi:putative endonuclease